MDNAPVSETAAADAPRVKVSRDEQRTILSKVIAQQMRTGVRIESQTDSQVVLAWGGKVNHVAHFLIGLLTFGIWWLVWLLLALRAQESKRLITVDEYGQITWKDM